MSQKQNKLNRKILKLKKCGIGSKEGDNLKYQDKRLYVFACELKRLQKSDKVIEKGDYISITPQGDDFCHIGNFLRNIDGDVVEYRALSGELKLCNTNQITKLKTKAYLGAKLIA